MKAESFSRPQRQSSIGVLLIFFTSLYRIFRGFWVLAVYLFLKLPAAEILLYIVMGIVTIVLLAFGYSYIYYRNFLFHIDHAAEEFILQKGIISTDQTAIPFEKIQQVYLKRTLLQRLINVYSLVIETAGSSEREVKISALSREKADQLSYVLTKAKKVEEKESDEEKEEKKLWTHQLDLPALLKIGISSNYLRGFALILAFFSTIYNEFRTFFENYSEQVSEFIEEVPGPAESVSVFLLLLILLLILSILITIIEVFIKYFDLKLEQTKENLNLEMGLKTNTRISLQPRRVQFLQIFTNPVQKHLDLYEARISLASSENELQKNKIKIPGLGREKLELVKSFLYSEGGNYPMEVFRPNRLLLFRSFTILGIPLVLSVIVLLFFPYTSFQNYSIFAVAYILVFGSYQYLMFKSMKLSVSGNFVQKKYGVWNKVEEQVEIYKLQAVTVQQPVWYKRKELLNLTFHTAGGDLSFRAVHLDILPFINYLLFKIESSRKPWM